MGLRDLVRVSWWTMQYTLGVLDIESVSRAATSIMKGLDEAAFASECADWVRAEVVPHITSAARHELARRRDEGMECALLTSTSPYVADPVAEHLDIPHVLSSRMAVSDGRFTGELEPPLCYGAGKVERAVPWAKAHGIDLEKSAFYTDSVSDVPMLEAVGEPRVVNPDPRLFVLARRRGWPVHRWS
jgi:HAD superfamily hydrolase (TIGR01490 family)